jgi:hypothetical protein
MPRAARRILFAAGVSLLAVGCRGRDVIAPDGRTVSLLVRADLSATATASVVVVVTATDIPTPLVFNLAVSNGTASGTVTLPVGSARTITMHAYDAGGVETHRGAVTVNIQAGINPTIVLVLTPLAGDVGINVTLGSLVITITPGADTLAVAGTAVFSAAIVDGTGAPILQPVTWGSMHPGIATVASTGDRTAQVTAVAPGVTTVVASFGGAAGSATIVVSAAPVLQQISSAFSSPLYLTQPPGDTSRLFVVEQTGNIRVIRNGQLLSTPFLDLTNVVSFGGERGLLSMAFHPNYVNNGQFFVDYTDRPNGNIQVARYTVSANPDIANAASAQPVININHSTFSNHNGGLVKFGPDGFLYVGVGDGGGSNNQLRTGQDTTKLLGKLLRINVNALPYVVPASNPFVGRPPAQPEIWAYGLRNPWRFSFDRETGDLYIADVGEGSREEVDVQPATSRGGENYGWSILEGSLCFDTTPCSSAGTKLPVFEYPHSGGTITGCSITGGYVYRGSRLPLLRGHYFFADYCSGWVRSFRYVSGAVVDLHNYAAEFGTLGNITSFGEDSRGELYIIVQSGSVYRIAPAP